ncbi:MAG TPA: folylpolyglutamate synthase/dihydrofolate synthase family protein [Longimicrobiales bacterium]|nr:folylpolyglutamate synthase/dihydrofolate synthase family protein [Longimicrobiales bacterium]
MSELTYEDLIRELFPRLTGGIRWGLDRTIALLDSVGNPHNSFRSIHIGGTNGKGSVAATAASILTASGSRVGLYTSPHLCTFRERIQIDGQAIGEDALVSAARKLWPQIKKLSPSFFEATTCIGFLTLAEAGVEVGVIEVGLGGRLDSTNVITPEVAVITNIAMDHSDYLGNSLAQIAREKAGIIKPGIPLVTAEEGAQNLEIFAESAGERLVRISTPARVSFNNAGTIFEYSGQTWTTPLIGEHQATNAALAIEAVSRLDAGLAPSSAVTKGLEHVRWPGRMQIETIGNQTWVFDVAHNVAGVQALVGTLTRLDLPKPVVLVIGILGDKDWQAMLPPLFAISDHVVLTLPPTAPSNRAWDPHRVLSAVPSDRARVVTDFSAALEQAQSLADEGTVVVAGSFHTVGDALISLGRAPFGSDLTLPRLSFSE